eukprot:TCONS_00003027-protein
MYEEIVLFVGGAAMVGAAIYFIPAGGVICLQNIVMTEGVSIMYDSAKGLITGKPKTKEEYLSDLVWTGLTAAATGGLGTFMPKILKRWGVSRKIIPAIGTGTKAIALKSLQELKSYGGKKVDIDTIQVDIDTLQETFYKEMGGSFYAISLNIQRRCENQGSFDNSAAIMELVIGLWLEKVKSKFAEIKYKPSVDQNDVEKTS